MTNAAQSQSSLHQREADHELATLAATGDKSARRRLMERLFNRTRRTLSYLSSGSADAEDLAQLALIQILQSIGNYRGDCTLEYWADRVAIQTAAKEFHKRKRRDQLISKSPLLTAPPPIQVDEIADKTILRRHLAHVLERLSQKNRTAIVLHYLYGYSVAEIADITGKRINTVRGRLREGRKHLRREVLEDTLLATWIKRREP